MNKASFVTLIILGASIEISAQSGGYKLLPSSGDDHDAFGRSVSINDEFAFVGASGGEKVFVFRRDEKEWIEDQILTGEVNPFGSTLDPLFGYSVKVSGDYLIVGAPFQVVPPVMNCIGAA